MNDGDTDCNDFVLAGGGGEICNGVSYSFTAIEVNNVAGLEKTLGVCE